MELAVWQNMAFVILLFFFLMFSLLDGFDLGIGMLLPLVRPENDSQKLIALIAPVVEGNKVWIVMGVAFLFAAFPQAFSILLSSFYLPLILAVLLFVVRALAIEISHHDAKHRGQWHCVIAAASFGIAFASLYSLSLIAEGLPLQSSGIPSVSPFDYLSPFSALFALVGTLAVLWHGIVYSKAKLGPSPLARFARPVWISLIAAMVILGSLYSITHPFAAIVHQVLLLCGFVIFFGGFVTGGVLESKRRLPFICSCLSILGLWICVGSVLFPDLVHSRITTQFHLNLMQISAPAHSLKMIVVSALLIIPFILVYTAFLYRAFADK